MEGNRLLSRRTLLQSAVASAYLRAATQDGEPSSEGQFALSPDDEQFLEELERSNFQFFWEQSNPKPASPKTAATCGPRIPTFWLRASPQPDSGSPRSASARNEDISPMRTPARASPPRSNSCGRRCRHIADS